MLYIDFVQDVLCKNFFFTFIYVIRRPSLSLLSLYYVCVVFCFPFTSLIPCKYLTTVSYLLTYLLTTKTFTRYLNSDGLNKFSFLFSRSLSLVFLSLQILIF